MHPRLSANLSLMFTDPDLGVRAAAAAVAGFDAVEIQYPYDTPAARLRTQLSAAGVPLQLINAPLGQAPGEKGLACDPTRRKAFRDSVMQGLDYAQHVGCPVLHVLSGRARSDFPRQQIEQTWMENMTRAAHWAEQAGVMVVIEALNPIDVPGYFLTGTENATRWVRQIDSPHLRLLFDTYHCAMNGEDCAAQCSASADCIGYVQIADSPGRHEPGTGQIDWPAFAQRLACTPYEGRIGCEYIPTRQPDARALSPWLAFNTV